MISSQILFLADVEAEDVDLGITEQTDLALDVDGDQVDDAEVDDEALDSDDDDENKDLGIDTEETESRFIFYFRSLAPLT